MDIVEGEAAGRGVAIDAHGGIREFGHDFLFFWLRGSAKNQSAGGKGRMESVISVPFDLLVSTMCLCDVPLGGARRQEEVIGMASEGERKGDG
jgi:hypothetical protein